MKKGALRTHCLPYLSSFTVYSTRYVTYCDLAVDAFGRGYSHYERLYQEGAGTLNRLNELFEGFPHIDDDAKVFLNEYAAKELGI
ncbi:hypothetical protein KDAU_34660 [Dictyobacter aurantiacus]|uniref:Uncharacterized protein n=1 Tax=Dictyobacter aurantiacus TaxID=1936993 RepID=A0A401ZGZ4_9CHLR|nr:hypothetical protein KDAU_34660 [Dictyobacter aurantiacus]